MGGEQVSTAVPFGRGEPREIVQKRFILLRIVCTDLIVERYSSDAMVT